MKNPPNISAKKAPAKTVKTGSYETEKNFEIIEGVSETLNTEDNNLEIEQQLLIEKRFSNATIDSLPGIFYMADIDGNFIRWNQQFNEVSGYSSEEIRRMKPGDFFEGNDRAYIKNKVSEVFSKGESSAEANLITKDGRKIPYLFTGKKIIFDQKPYLIGAGINLNLLKITEKNLRESKERYRAFVNNSSEGIWCFEITEPFSIKLPVNEQIDRIYKDGTLAECNNKMAQMYGFESSEDLIGKTPGDLMVRSDPANEKYLRAFIESGYQLSDTETHEKDKDGNDVYFLNSLVGIIEDEHFVRAWGTQRDITVLKQTENAFIELEKQLQQSQKIEPLGRLAGGIAHDFNNFLAVIMLQTDIINRELPEDSPLRFRIKEIKTVTNNAAKMVSQLLAFGRKQTLQAQPVTLNQIVEEFTKAIGTIIGEDVEIKLNLEKDLGVCVVDPNQMTQVLINLAVNSRDAMPKGGILEIGTANVTIDKNTFKHKAQPKGSYVQLSVSDTGTGMSPKTKKHLFEPFFTTKEPSKGTGLGLATVYGIVKQSNGFIWVDSQLKKGTTFKIQFPRTDLPARVVRQEKEPKLLRGTETVMVVEDEESIRRPAVEILDTLGYNVLEAEDVNQALQIAEAYEEDIHLLVTDVVMPKMNGKELARNIKTLHPEMTVLFISGYTDDIIARHGILEEDVYFLGKPFSPPTLARKVRQSLES